MTTDLNINHWNISRYTGSLEDWLRGTSFPGKTVELFKRFCYLNGETLFFGDKNIVLETISDLEGKRRFLKMLCREQTFLLYLKLTADSNTEELDGYWSRGRRAKDILPMLESIKESGLAEKKIDIIHLLPRFARARIYLYPDMSSSNPAAKIRRDCHWSALNFFNSYPDDVYGTDEGAISAFEKNYHQIQSTPLLGDLVAYIVDNRVVYHSAVYIADDIVFTKNGDNVQSPWMFMRLKDMKNYYPRTKFVQVFFRRNDL